MAISDVFVGLIIVFALIGWFGATTPMSRGAYWRRVGRNVVVMVGAGVVHARVYPDGLDVDEAAAALWDAFGDGDTGSLASAAVDMVSGVGYGLVVLWVVASTAHAGGRRKLDIERQPWVLRVVGHFIWPLLPILVGLPRGRGGAPDPSAPPVAEFEAPVPAPEPKPASTSSAAPRAAAVAVRRRRREGPAVRR